MGLGGSLVVVAAVCASASAISLPGVPLCPGTDRRVVGQASSFELLLLFRHSAKSLKAQDERLATSP